MEPSKPTGKTDLKIGATPAFSSYSYLTDTYIDLKIGDNIKTVINGYEYTTQLHNSGTIFSQTIGSAPNAIGYTFEEGVNTITGTTQAWYTMGVIDTLEIYLNNVKLELSN